MRVALRLWTMAVVLALALFAQKSNKPDFSGTWQLDVQRTRFGEVPQPKSLVIQIEHHEPQIRILTVTTTEKGEARETLDLITDGKEHAQTTQGQPCVASARWDQWTGTHMVIEESCAGNLVSRRFTLGTKGRILTTILTVKDRSREQKAYEFFFRQGS
jgi:hypothetical protein